MDTFEALQLNDPVFIVAPPTKDFSVYDMLMSKDESSPAYVCRRSRAVAGMLRTLSECGMLRPTPYGHALKCYDISKPSSSDTVRCATFYELYALMFDLGQRIKASKLISHKRKLFMSVCIEDEVGRLHEVHARHFSKQNGWELDVAPVGSVLPGVSVYRFMRQSTSVHV